ncbi:porin [Geoalkalibacter sp.]|uniref:porin n=1 Tax=Geoalkalibacter sp. TaxID=3041440 RepID=UPI00272ECAAF|nr:porin [Geoalkalibacter sp.]
MLRRISGFILFTFFVCLTLPPAAQSAITLYDADETTFSVDGSFNTFYVYSSSDKNAEMEAISGPDREQSRVKMGFLPNWIGFNFSKQVNNLKLGGRSSFWVTINDSDNNLTETGIDVRQFYGTVDADWGQVLFGKDFTLFNRSNIFLDEILLGYGNVSDTLGLIDGNGVSFGNIGTGYTYPFPSAQITYRTPQLHGFKLAVGVIDPSRTADEGQEKTPRFEGELTFNHKFESGDVTAWGGFLYQKSESNAQNGMDITSKGVSYGVRARYAGFSLHASGFNAEGLGFLLGPGADTTLGLPVAGPGGELDSNGWLLQASYTYGPLRFVGSYGENELKAADKWENQTATGAVFYNVNDYFKLVAEYNVNEISIGTAEEETKTVALGAILNF